MMLKITFIREHPASNDNPCRYQTMQQGMPKKVTNDCVFFVSRKETALAMAGTGNNLKQGFLQLYSRTTIKAGTLYTYKLTSSDQTAIKIWYRAIS